MNITKWIISLSGIIIGVLIAFFVKPFFGVNLGIGFILLWCCGYILGSLKTVGPNELAMETFFGKPTNHYEAGKGLVLIPFGFYKLTKVASVTYQFQIPGDPEKVFKGKDTEPLPDDTWVRPMRIFTGQEDPLTDDPLSGRLHGVFSAIIRWRILDYNKFTRNIGSVDEAQRQMRDTAEKALVEKLGTMSPREIIKKIGAAINEDGINAKLVATLQKLVNGDDNGEDGWGIKIEDFQLLAPDFGQTLSAAISDARSASFTKEAAIKVAEGEAKTIELKGVAEAKTIEVKGEAEAKSIKARGLAEAAVMKEKGISASEAENLMRKVKTANLKELAKELELTEKALLLQLETFEKAISNVGANGHLYFNLPDMAAIPQLLGSIKNS